MKRNRKHKDLTGQHFGRWTVLGFVDRETLSNGNTAIRWLCRCDCGVERVVRGTYLTSGNSRSCGCARREHAHRPITDMTGYRVGTFTVRHSTTERDNREVVWSCVCDCGREKLIRGSYLRRHVGLSCDVCGGYPSAMAAQERKRREVEMIGRRYGRWVIVAAGDKPGWWSCVCDCGTKRDVAEQSLFRGKSTSCGCSRKDVAYSFDDLSGRVFGELSVIEREADRFYPDGGRAQMYRCVCSCGNESHVARSMLVSGQTRSCGCVRMSHMEHDVMVWLDEHHVAYERQKTFDALQGVGFGSLSYDFACGRVLIECQGEQHYRPVDFFGGDAKYVVQVEHDRRKRVFAMEHGYKLIELPYTMRQSDIHLLLGVLFKPDEEDKQASSR